MRQQLARWSRLLGFFGLLAMTGCGGERTANPRSEVAASKVVTRARAEAFCGACHAFPPPDSFPKESWAWEVRRGYDFYNHSGRTLDVPPMDGVTAWYQDRAPTKYPVIPPTPERTGFSRHFDRRDLPGPNPADPTAVSYVAAVRWSGSNNPDLIACDMGRGELLIHRADDSEAPACVLARDLGHPAHAEVVDLDGDGIKDMIVADLGVPMPSDARRGRVLWLKGTKDGGVETIPVASGLGRVCDVQAADFDGDGDLDLIAAVFGWRDVGEILYLEQRPRPGRPPEFVRKTIDGRHGTIHVPVVDLDRDGRPDFVALIAQEHETVVAFLNRGQGRFEPRTLFSAPHPAFGSSGISMVDLDADGDLDVLMTNGDVYDTPLLKPFHGVSWLENRSVEAPFVRHEVGALYGAQRAMAGDLDGDGDLDIVATSFLGEPFFGAERKKVAADAVTIFEQVKPGEFRRHALEREACDYPTVALGDLDGDGKLDIIAGRFRDFRFGGLGAMGEAVPGRNEPIVIWK